MEGVAGESKKCQEEKVKEGYKYRVVFLFNQLLLFIRYPAVPYNRTLRRHRLAYIAGAHEEEAEVGTPAITG